MVSFFIAINLPLKEMKFQEIIKKFSKIFFSKIEKKKPHLKYVLPLYILPLSFYK